MILDTEIVNRGRQPELDVARAISCILMVVCHVGLYVGFANSEFLNTFSEVVGAEFAAPVFMALMGIGICYSGHSTPRQMAVRGLKLLLMGYMLGFVRQGIPMLIFGRTEPFFTVKNIFEVDILQFAGLAMMAVALFRKLKVPTIAVFMLSVVFVGIGESLSFVSTGAMWSDLIADLLWGANEFASFSFLHWFFYVAFGMLFGEILQHCSDKRRLYRTLLPVSAVGVAFVYTELAIYDVSYYNASNYYFMGVKNAVFALFYVLFLFSVSWFLSGILKPGAMKVFGNLSRCLNPIYCISWILIYYLAAPMLHFGFRFPDWVIYVLMAVITVVSYFLAVAYVGFKKKHFVKKKEN